MRLTDGDWYFIIARVSNSPTFSSLTGRFPDREHSHKSGRIKLTWLRYWRDKRKCNKVRIQIRRLYIYSESTFARKYRSVGIRNFESSFGMSRNKHASFSICTFVHCGILVFRLTVANSFTEELSNLTVPITVAAKCKNCRPNEEHRVKNKMKTRRETNERVDWSYDGFRYTTVKNEQYNRLGHRDGLFYRPCNDRDATPSRNSYVMIYQKKCDYVSGSLSQCVVICRIRGRAINCNKVCPSPFHGDRRVKSCRAQYRPINVRRIACRRWIGDVYRSTIYTERTIKDRKSVV